MNSYIAYSERRVRDCIAKDFPDCEIRSICAIAKDMPWEPINCGLSAVPELVTKGYRWFRFRLLPAFQDEVQQAYHIHDFAVAHWQVGDQMVVYKNGRHRGKVLAVCGDEALLGYRVDEQLHLMVIDRHCPIVLKTGTVTKKWRKAIEGKDLPI